MTSCRFSTLVYYLFLVLNVSLICGTTLSYINQNDATNHDPTSASSRALEASSFHALERKFNAICSNRTINKVLNRMDEANQDMPDEERDWSLHSDAMKSFFDSTLRHCRTVEEIIQSSEAAISLNVEKPCRIWWLNHEEICDTLSRYASMEFIGDSITRHINGALFMILTEDFERGSFGLNLNQLSKEEFDSCRCDGQFSESKLCRLHCVDRVGMGTEDFRRLHQCPASVTTSLNVNYEMPTQTCAPPRLEGAAGESSSGRAALRFLFLQGGTHYDTESAAYFNQVKEIMRSLKQSLDRCDQKSSSHFRVAFSGVPIVSTAVEQKYPLQSKIRAIRFFEEMAKLLKAEFPTVVPVSFLNLTEYAELHGYTSDGFHQLSDVNMIKAMTLLNLMHALAIEPAYNVSLSDQ